MSAPTADEGGLRVTNNPAQQRYELHRGDALVGATDYRREGDSVVLAHVFVEPAFRNRGFGARLVEGALADIEARGLSAVPECPFAAWYLSRR